MCTAVLVETTHLAFRAAVHGSVMMRTVEVNAVFSGAPLKHKLFEAELVHVVHHDLKVMITRHHLQILLRSQVLEAN